MEYKAIDIHNEAVFLDELSAILFAEKRAKKYHLTVSVYECEDGECDYEIARYVGL